MAQQNTCGFGRGLGPSDSRLGRLVLHISVVAHSWFCALLATPSCLLSSYTWTTNVAAIQAC